MDFIFVIGFIFLIILLLRRFVEHFNEEINTKVFKNKNATTKHTDWETITREQGNVFKPEDFHFIKPNKSDNPNKEDTYLPYGKRPLLTNTERNFAYILQVVCDAYHFRICPKVRMEDFIYTYKTKSKVKHEAYRNRIKSRHIDFLICDKDFNILCAIELDDPTHETEEAQETDEFKNSVYQKIGIKLFRIKTSDDYKVKVKEMMLYAIGKSREIQSKRAEEKSHQETT